MSEKVVLEMKNISKTFPGVKALKNVEFSVNKGEVMALMGENGAGKSTLIKIITGYYNRDLGEGEILFEGRPVNVSNTLEAQRLGISTIFQELNLSPFLSVAENIYLGNTPKKNGFIDWEKLYEDSNKILLDLGINIDVTAKLHEQSTAVQQMVAIARALSIDTKLLIMDEATSSLENNEVKILFDVIRKLRDRGISTIFITHKMDEIYKICDRVTIFKDGEFVTCRNIKEITKLELISLMIGRDASELLNKKKKFNPDLQNAEVICSIKGIKKANKKLKGIDIEIRKGEIVGLAGLLGSGRTELAKVLFADDIYYDGEIIFRQQHIKFKSPNQSIKEGLAFCSEDRKTEGIFPTMTIEDNLTMSILERMGKFGIMNNSKKREITKDYIKKMSIKTPSTTTRIKDLSGGNQQKVILSRCLATEPDLIILDEPTRGIDVGAKGEIEDLIQSVANAGISVLYISSELDELVRGCDRVVVLKEGEKIKELVGDDISSDNILSEIAIHEVN